MCHFMPRRRLFLSRMVVTSSLSDECGHHFRMDHSRNKAVHVPVPSKQRYRPLAKNLRQHYGRCPPPVPKRPLPFPIVGSRSFFSLTAGTKRQDGRRYRRHTASKRRSPRLRPSPRTPCPSRTCRPSTLGTPSLPCQAPRSSLSRSLSLGGAAGPRPRICGVVRQRPAAGGSRTRRQPRAMRGAVICMGG